MTTFYSVEFFKGTKSLGFNVSKSPNYADARTLVKNIRAAQPELRAATVVILKREGLPLP